MKDVEVGHRMCYPAEFVHQRSINIVEKLGAHKAWRVVRFAFQNSKKKSVNFCLDRGSRLPSLQTRKPTDSTVSISAFLSSEVEIVEISVHLKSKNALYYVVIMFVLSFCSIVFCFTCVDCRGRRMADFDFAKIHFFHGLQTI